MMFSSGKLDFTLCFAADQDRKEAGATESQAEAGRSASTDFSIQESLLAPQFEFQSQL